MQTPTRDPSKHYVVHRDDRTKVLIASQSSSTQSGDIMLEELDTVSNDYYQKHFLSEDKAGKYGPLMRSAKQADVLKLLALMYENTTVDVEWSEDTQEMNVRAIKNLLRNNRCLLIDALRVYGYDSYEDALRQTHE